MPRADWLERARGRFVGLLMDDDELVPDFLQAVVSRFAEDSSLGVVFTNHYFRANAVLREWRCGLPEGRYDDFLLPLLRYRPVAVSASLMRREVWEQVRSLPDMVTADVVLFVRAALRALDVLLRRSAAHGLPGPRRPAFPRRRAVSRR